MYIPTATDETIGQLEHALELCTRADAIDRRVRDAVKKKRLTRKATTALLQDAVQLGVITADERELIGRAEVARAAVVAVDDFPLETYMERGLEPSEPLGTVATHGAASPRAAGAAPDTRAAG
jgi:acyl-CoA dehydrogenase